MAAKREFSRYLTFKPQHSMGLETTKHVKIKINPYMNPNLTPTKVEKEAMGPTGFFWRV